MIRDAKADAFAWLTMTRNLLRSPEQSQGMMYMLRMYSGMESITVSDIHAALDWLELHAADAQYLAMDARYASIAERVARLEVWRELSEKGKAE